MRAVEHRPAACVPSPENIRDSPLPPNQRVTNPLDAQTGSPCSAYTGLPRQAPDIHPGTKNRAQRLGKPQHDTSYVSMPGLADWSTPRGGTQ
jgi:hypothetical protein